MADEEMPEADDTESCDPTQFDAAPARPQDYGSFMGGVFLFLLVVIVLAIFLGIVARS